MKTLLWMTLPTLLLAGCNKPAAPTVNETVDNEAMSANVTDGAMMAPTNTAAGMPVTDASTYLAKAGAGDMFEIESSKAIAAKTANADIKAFANMMIAQHGQSTAKLKAAAAAAKLSVATPALDAAQQAALDKIKSATGTGADQAYLDAQRTAHDDALALHKGYADKGDTPQLKAAAGEIAPVVEHHIAALAKLSAG